MESHPNKLLDQVRDTLRDKHHGRELASLQQLAPNLW